MVSVVENLVESRSMAVGRWMHVGMIFSYHYYCRAGINLIWSITVIRFSYYYDVDIIMMMGKKEDSVSVSSLVSASVTIRNEVSKVSQQVRSLTFRG